MTPLKSRIVVDLGERGSPCRRQRAPRAPARWGRSPPPAAKPLRRGPTTLCRQHFDLAMALDDQPFDHVEGIHLGLSQMECGDIPARRRSLPTQASGAIEHAVALQNAADGPDAGQREQGVLGAQRVGNDLRPVNPRALVVAKRCRQAGTASSTSGDVPLWTCPGARQWVLRPPARAGRYPPERATTAASNAPPHTRPPLAVGVGLGGLPRPCGPDGREAFFFIMSSPPMSEEYTS